jgi:hypothetical protein
LADLPRTNAQQVTAAVSIVGTTETLVVNSQSLPVPLISQFALIFAFFQLTVGAGQTTVTPRIRRGVGITGTLVGVASALTAIAANLMGGDVMAVDTLTSQDSAQYSLTLQQAGGAGSGSVPFATILVLLL